MTGIIFHFGTTMSRWYDRNSYMKLCVKTGMAFTAVLLSVMNAGAQHRSAGSVNYQHLLINYDARSVGLAGASAALQSGLNGASANPAVLATIKQRQGFVGYQLILDGVWAAPVAYAHPVENIGTVAVMFQGLSSGRLEIVDIGADGEPDSTGASARDDYLTPSVSIGRTFLNSRLSVGVSVKGLYHRIAVPPEVFSSKGIACDLGVQYRILADRLIVGAVVRNAGFEFDPFSGEETFPVPTLFEAGISYVPRYLSSFRLAADVNLVRGDYVNIEPGLEIEIYPDVLYGRLGFAFSQMDLSEQLRKFSGDQDDGYTKSNWTTLATGVGLVTGLKGAKVFIDFGLQFRIEWLPPSPVLSAVVEF